MLILGRKAGERIKIGDDVYVRVIKTQDNRVTLGIEAPDEVLILRGEISDRKEAA